MAEFHHRAWHNSIVIGDYLYIDGGEITTWNGSGNGSLPGGAYYAPVGDIITLPNNRTYSIDLRNSWTNESVVLNSIFKAAPMYSNAALWPDVDGASFYSYDGGYSYSIPVNNQTKNELWKFTPNGDLGSWSIVDFPSTSNFSSLTQVLAGSYGYGHGFGYALGGRENWRTNSQFEGDTFYPPGLVTYDTSTQIWQNVSATGYSRDGMAQNGIGHFVPTFGPEGLMFFLGGDVGDTIVSYTEVAMYDPTTQRWGQQQTTGDIPTPSEAMCVVGVAGDNGTYEIFLYGGWQSAGDTDDALANGIVHVLTLPAFRWLKQTTSAVFARAGPSCNVVGKRQMAVIGGVPITSNSTTSNIPPDPWNNGIGIYDLSTMEWRPEYDPNAAPYVSPNVVKDYYRDNSRFPEWSTAQVKEWFVQNNTSSNNSNSTGSSDQTSKIAGGVVGGVCGVALIAFIIWFFILRGKPSKRGSAEHKVEETHEAPDLAELRANNQSQLMSGGSERYEMNAQAEPKEAGSSAVFELP